MDYLALFWIFYFTLLSSAKCVKVSFFGASHIAMPLQEAKISTNIRLKFRTYQENAMILLAAGRTDYCLLGLDSGRIKFLYKVDDFIVELWSPNKHYFNDFQLHDIAIHRYETNISLQIDEIIVKKNLPARINELNVHFGVFLGGLGDFSESYLTTIDNFRGCISDVYYNNINVFKRAKEKTSHVSSVQVAWTCSTEFEADEHRSISFIEDDSYVMLAKPVVQTGESWNLELRTIETLGMILYNGGIDYVGLEIVDAKLRLLVGKGSNAVELMPDRNVSDGKWHNISISYSPTNVELLVDGTVHNAPFANGSSNVLEIGEEYFIGGIGEQKKKRAALKGLRAVEQSLRGCVRNLMIDNQKVGFPHLKVTQGVSVDCVWNYPCIEKTPCIMSSICQQYDVDDFICYCDQAYCLKADFTDKYKIFTRSDLPMEMELLAISPLQVLEGDSAFLSTHLIDVLIDYTKLHIMEAGVVFNIVQPPRHGKILVNSFGTDETNSTQNKFFSLIDLSTDKIKYTHNGLEHFNDHMTIDLQLITNNRELLPDFLQGKHRFVLHANITPVNDPPVLTIPPNKIFRLTQGIPKVIRPDMLNAEDPDSPAASLMYSFLTEPESESQDGQIEVGGKVVSTFSQNDVNEGLVTYLINKQTNEDISFQLAIQVSDGMETSPAVYLTVSVQPLQLRMINNTGLILVHKSAALITPWNLSFTSNSDDDNVDVKYTIVQPAQFGNVQKLRTVDSSWITVDSFTSDQILLGHIRYIHNVDFPIHDEFKFIAAFGPIKTQKYDFRLTFTKLKIGIQTQNSLQINGTRETIISPQNLYHQTTPLPTFARNIIYTVVTPPKYGLIYVEGHPEYAKKMDSFTQQDLDKNIIRYRTHLTCYSSFVDLFEFVVTVPECEDVIGSIKMVYNPPETLLKMLSYQTRERVQVNEGDRTALNRRNFQVLFNKFNYLTFNISKAPSNGNLCQYDVQQSKMTAIETFTLASLYLGDIYYCHDDSESTEDSVSFLVLSDWETDFQYICEVYINVTLVNDNGPYQISKNVFHVVRNQSKIISINDLQYIDPDISTNETNILFTRLLTTNGEFYKSNVLTDHFTQDDVTHGRVLLKHTEPDNGTASFIVTDGFFEVPGTLTVYASDPFIKIPKQNASIVQETKYVVLKMEDLSIETNLNSKPDEIEYRILNEPSYGFLKILRRKFNGTMLPRSNNVTSIKNFTQQDVERERLIYWNTAVASMDKIRYRVSTKGISAEGEISLLIYPAAYWDLLQIKRNQTLYVEESTSVAVSREILEIVHPNISPGDITYLVTTSPQHGYLEIQSITSDDEYNNVFDQSTINSERMFYIQAGVNQSSDFFIFNVTNGITWLRGLMLRIVIIPEHLYMQTNNVSVDEGKSLKLEPEDMQPFSEYYLNKILEYKIVQQPAFGHIKSGKSKVNRFTHKQLEAGQIQYQHDGSENDTDFIRFIACARNKESVPYDLMIEIRPVNDEMPQIVTNTGLQMWVGGRAVIKNTDLMAQDYDTAPEHLTFLVTNVIGGTIIRIDDAGNQSPAASFTQSDINNEEIYFVHDSSHLNGQINFSITDVEHVNAEQVLHVVTNPVTLDLVRNENLHVFPLTRKQILPEQLQFRCSDQARDVRFVVTIAPQTGHLLYEFAENGTTMEVREFTQNDIDMGRILYEHTHTMVELKSNDSFYFDVTAKLANSLIDQIFHIEISVSSGGLLRFLPVPRLYLDEGDSAPIRLDLSKVLEYLETRAGIQSPELYIDSYLPSHGLIEAPELRNSSRFSLNDFNAGKVFYRHDHSDTLEDKILMSVYLTQGQIFLCNLTLPVVINPVNDNPFYLVTQSPQMSIVEGENRTITKDDLYTKDLDTDPSDIIYDIISPPTLGALKKISDEGFAQDIIMYGNQFSQLDINENRIQYFHYGLVQSTTFYFRVSDGQFKPAYEIFNLLIVPISIGQGQEPEIVSVQQGSNLALIEAKHIPVETNAHKSRLIYNITESPVNGYILVENRANKRFSQAQLDAHQVNYIQTDMNKSTDTFKVNVYIPESSPTTPNLSFFVKINVEPIIKINGISITSSDKIRLTATIALDNPTQLKLNRYNPKITITRKPDHGIIRKIIRTSGDAAVDHSKDKDVKSFTYKELNSGIVYFIARTLPDEVLSINDYFEYVLHIKSVQPGQGFVPIEIHKVVSHVGEGINENVDVAIYEAFPFNYIVIISMILIMFVLIILMIILMKCRASKCDKNKSDKDYPPPLPRPPDFMGLNNNNRLYSSSEGGDSIPVTASSTPLPVLSSIPHCKVIPIELDDSESDDMVDMNLDSQQVPRYPYGDENDEWSSSCDVGNEVNYSSIAQPQQQPGQRINNPLLRRNQYWV